MIGQAYKLLSELGENAENMDKDTICRIHSSLMKTCQFSGKYYVPAGKTRTETRKTVIVAGSYNIECCPFSSVDDELEYICRMTKVRGFVCMALVCVHTWSYIAMDQVVEKPIRDCKLDVSRIR